MKRTILETVLTLVILFLLILVISFFMLVFDRSFEESAINTILVLIAVHYSDRIKKEML